MPASLRQCGRAELGKPCPGPRPLTLANALPALQGEIMTGMDGYRNETQKMSQLTLALMDDSGWYVPRWVWDQARRGGAAGRQGLGEEGGCQAPGTSADQAAAHQQAFQATHTYHTCRYEYTMNLTMGYQAGCAFHSSTSSGYIASNPSQVRPGSRQPISAAER
jgi:hypothetical protein